MFIEQDEGDEWVDSNSFAVGTSRRDGLRALRTPATSFLAHLGIPLLSLGGMKRYRLIEPCPMLEERGMQDGERSVEISMLRQLVLASIIA